MSNRIVNALASMIVAVIAAVCVTVIFHGPAWAGSMTALLTYWTVLDR